MTDTPETDATTCLRCAESDRNFRAALRVIANLEETIHRMDFQKKLNRECIDQITARTKERDEARAQLAAERELADRLALALKMTRWDSPVTCKKALAAWKEARNES